MSRSNHRDALLTAAKQLLREKGYARTTARDLVAASDTNLASIGYHFGSKEALLTEALGEVFEEWTARLEDVGWARPDVAPIERLTAALSAMVAELDDARPLFVAYLEAMAQAERSPELRERLARQYEDNRRQVATSIAAAIGESPDAEVVASLLIAIADGLLIQAFLQPGRLPAGDEFVAALGRALGTALAVE
jgi:AcrR family transcriptional regulator